MRLLEFDDAAAFSQRVNPFLMQREVERCIEIGILHRLLHRAGKPLRGEELPRPILWAVVDDGDQVVAVALQSVSKRMIVSRASDEAISLIPDQLADRGGADGTLIGVVPCAQKVSRDYARLTNRATK